MPTDSMQTVRALKTLAGSPAYLDGGGVNFWVVQFGPANEPPTAEGMEVSFALMSREHPERLAALRGRTLLVQVREGYESEEQQGKWIWETSLTISGEDQPVTLPVPSQNAVYIGDWSNLALRTVLLDPAGP